MNSIEKAVERLKQASQGTARSGADEKKTVAHPAPENGSAGSGGSAQDASLWHIKFAELERQGFLTPHQGRSNEAEEYRLLKRPILMNAFGKGAAPVPQGNLVIITSALPGEGKTFTAINLAMSMAMEMDTTVLLVDSDVIKPSLTGMFGLGGRAGLIDVLASGVDPRKAIVKTELDKLRVLPAGSPHRHSTELLASEQMRRFTKDLSERYSDRVVLFDAPPLLATTEAIALSHLAGQIMVVVETGRTPHGAVKEAISRLDREKVIGTILNKNTRAMGSDYYGYSSYYEPSQVHAK